MSWWVYLKDTTAEPWCDYGTPLDQWKPKYDYETEPCPEPCYPNVSVSRHQEGGTYRVGGTDEAEMNVTYNYSRHFHEALGDGLEEAISGKRAGDVLPMLAAGRDKLGMQRDRDYWASTPGNAGIVLAILAAWAEEHPDGIFLVS